MLGTRYEQYVSMKSGLPFVLYTDIERNQYNLSAETNWHENLELQFCVKGSGEVLQGGEKYPFCENDIAVINSDCIHYTMTSSELIYDVILIGTDFCRQMNIDIKNLCFAPIIKNAQVSRLFKQLKEVYSDLSDLTRIAKLNKLILEILIEICQNHTEDQKADFAGNKNYERIKRALLYIRTNYGGKITLDDVSKSAIIDKYTLCKEFKKYTGQTVFENLNMYRCIKAVELLESGKTVSETALLCGFDNFSFFTKTFKKYIGKLPSQCKEYKR